jgi:PHD/YefM family antitoxin component YafN of YafNO toxin-antitoxin module
MKGIFKYSFLKLLMAKSMQRLVSIPKEDLESLEATIETLQNEYVMEQLKKSEIDIRKGRVRNIEKFIKELKESQ